MLAACYEHGHAVTDRASGVCSRSLLHLIDDKWSITGVADNHRLTELASDFDTRLRFK